MSNKQIVISPRTVAHSCGRYVITIPPKIGRKLHGKLVKVIIEVIEPLEESKGEGT